MRMGAAFWFPMILATILTNGRLFSDPALAEALVAIAPDDVIWAVPLYGDVSDA